MIRASTTPGTCGHLAPDRLGDPPRLQGVLAGDPDVDRRRLALIHGRPDHAAGVEGELQVVERRVCREAGAEQVDVFLGRVVAMLDELDLDHGVHRAGVGRVGGRQVGDHPDLGDDDLDVVADRLADELLDPLDLLLGLLDPGPAGRPGVDLERAGVDLREEFASELAAQQAEDRHQRHHGAENDQESASHRPIELADVPADADVDQPLPPGECCGQHALSGRGIAVSILLRVTVADMRSEPSGGPGRDEGPRQEVGGDHRERHGRGHGPIEEFAQARHQRQRGEHQERAEAGHQLRHRHLAGTPESRLLGRGPQAEMPVGILQADDGAVTRGMQERARYTLIVCVCRGR